MGRGNVSVNGKYEGLYYLDMDRLDMYYNAHSEDCEALKTRQELQDAGIKYGYNPEAGVSWHYDGLASRDQWDDMVEYMRNRFERRFASFYRADRWTRDKHIVLENSFLALRCFEWVALLVPPAGLKIYSIGWVPSAMCPSPPRNT